MPFPVQQQPPVVATDAAPAVDNLTPHQQLLNPHLPVFPSLQQRQQQQQLLLQQQRLQRQAQVNSLLFPTSAPSDARRSTRVNLRAAFCGIVRSSAGPVWGSSPLLHAIFLDNAFAASLQ